MKFIKFLGVGSFATVIQYGILVLLVETGLAVALTASTIGYIVSSAFNYTLNYYFTFRSEARHQAAALKFSVVGGYGDQCFDCISTIGHLKFLLSTGASNCHYCSITLEF